MVLMKHKSRTLALRAVKVAAATVDHLSPRRRGAVFLIYHRVGRGAELESELSPAAFEEQMSYLADTGRAVSIDDALAALESTDVPEQDPVVVTFDDGTADFAEHAVPTLERYQVPAILYLATDFIEQQRPFPNDGAPVTWPSLRDALSTELVSIGSHTHTHAVLDRASGALADDELDRSIGLIHDRLGIDAKHFAYPKGVAGSPSADAAVRKRFRSAALGVIAPNPYGATDRYLLARTPVQASDGMRWFARKADGGMSFEGTLRRALNARRYAGTTT
jgi:peptidoglycan/xylan/chitin deacetylase (PgdA/CDA1 family)